MRQVFTKKYVTYLIILALIGGVIGLIWFLKNRNDQGLATVQKIKIGYPELRIALPVFVADKKGFFKNNGLDYELVAFPTAQPMMDALVAGKSDSNDKISIAGYCALPITFGAIGRSKVPLIFLTSMMEDNNHPISVLIVKKDSGIKSVKDLKGKRVGILPTRAYEVWLKKVLSTNEVEPSTVIIQQVAPQEQSDALLSGSVDALFTNDPAATAAMGKANGEMISANEALVPKATGISPFYFGSFNITKEFADANPEIVKKIAKSLDEAIAFIKANPEESREIMKGFLPKQAAIVDKFKDSLFLSTKEVTNDDLLKMHNYYKTEGILSESLDIANAQYR